MIEIKLIYFFNIAIMLPSSLDANATYFSTLQAFDGKESEDVRPSNVRRFLIFFMQSFNFFL